MGSAAGADDSKQPVLVAAAANGQGLVETAHAPAADVAADSQEAPEHASAAAVPIPAVKAKPETAVKQQAPVPAANGALAIKAEPFSRPSASAGLAAPPATAAAAGSCAHQDHTLPEKGAQGDVVKAEPDAKIEASMQNGAPAVKPEEEQKQEGTAHTGHDSEEESELEDEDEEHDNQV